ncbi:E3 ubiquitin-protein ligase TRIM39-like [Lepisosteus oculatus]|uniref:E3 ubiquitin-protein ligase TRIM39-like n=1 Tax=Lepisosteus oculatus TaxID=7918 RepID=UPI00073FAA37|nr:PREDICTED: E3 ubiquitin-protein ligase TRIM39-like [Lepisosteus oculatus]
MNMEHIYANIENKSPNFDKGVEAELQSKGNLGVLESVEKSERDSSPYKILALICSGLSCVLLITTVIFSSYYFLRQTTTTQVLPQNTSLVYTNYSSSNWSSSAFKQELPTIVEDIQNSCFNLQDNLTDVHEEAKRCSDTIKRHNLVPLCNSNYVIACSVLTKISKRERRIPTTVWKWIQNASADVVLDPDTAHVSLNISNDGKCAVLSDVPQSSASTRFTVNVGVLGKVGFISGRHYWEVDVRDNLNWGVGIFRGSAPRNTYLRPENGAWAVERWSKTKFSFITEPRTLLSQDLLPQRVGVYVDCEEGQLSFYKVETQNLIYTANVHFTEKYYPLFYTESKMNISLVPVLESEY